MSRNIITPKARLSYPKLFTPQAPEKPGDKPKWGGAFIFEEGTDLEEMKAAALEVAVSRHGAEAADLIRAGKIHWPFRTDAKDGYPAGCTWMNINTTQQPGVIGPNKEPMTERDVYPGCYVRASIGAYYFDRGTKKGVTFGLNNVQKLADGERLDNRKMAEEEFDEVPTDDVAPTAAAQESLAQAPKSMKDLGL